jgi:hypothetical protein
VDSASVLDRMVRQGLLAKVRSDRGLGAPYVYSVTTKALRAAGYPSVEAMREVIASRFTPAELAAIANAFEKDTERLTRGGAERSAPRGRRRARVAGPADGRGRAMTAGDPIRAAQQVKRTATLLRDARAVLRKLDVLAAAARAADDPAHADIAALRDGCERLVSQLGHCEQTLQRRARDAVRRLR